MAILDLAMEGHRGGEFPAFDEPAPLAGCSALLPSPFASVLRRAFMPAWTDEDFMPTGQAADLSPQMWAVYVLAAFEDRYELTGGSARSRPAL